MQKIITKLYTLSDKKILLNLIISALIVIPIYSNKKNEKSIEEIIKEVGDINLTLKIIIDKNNDFLFTLLDDSIRKYINDEEYMAIYNQILSIVTSNKKIVNYVFEDEEKYKKEIKTLRDQLKTKPDDIDILAIKDEITRKQLLALLNVIRETALPEVYHQQKEILLKALKEHEKLSSLLKEELKMNLNHKHPDFESDAHHFIPKIPKSLTAKEKNIDVLERIKKKYIGDIPAQVQDTIFYFNNYENCVKNDLSIHNRLLLHGKPGTGKSYLVQVLAEELELPFLFFTASFFGDKYIGESSRRIRKAFQVAKEYGKPILLFIDEIDALATKRKETTHTEHRAALLTLLSEMQDIQDNKNIFIFAATNNFKVLDKAIKDRFSGAVCEIKELPLQYKAQLISKIFRDKGKIINPAFAQRLAEVIEPGFLTKNKNHFSNRDIVYIVTTSLLKYFADYSKNLATTKHFSAYVRTTIDGMTKKGRFAWFRSMCGNEI